jgi:putative transposase
MPRIARVFVEDAAVHVLNRGNNRKAIFHKPEDYAAFLRLMCEAHARVATRLLAYVLMPNHFHFIIWPREAGEISAYMRWLMNAHVRHYHQHYGTTGYGHIYQGRYKAFHIQTDRYLLNALIYVEANAYRAGLVTRAEDWLWSSANARREDRPEISAWPIERPVDWSDYLNQPLPSEGVRRLRRSVGRGCPYGSEEWTKQVVVEHGLEFTLRGRGRPREMGTLTFSQETEKR